MTKHDPPISFCGRGALRRIPPKLISLSKITHSLVRRWQRFRYKNPRGSAPKSLEGRPQAWPKYHLENLQTTPENHLAKKSHKPQSLPARPARRTSRNDREISTKNLDDRPNFWSFTFAKDSSNLICKKPPASLRTSCGYLLLGNLLPMQRFIDSAHRNTTGFILWRANCSGCAKFDRLGLKCPAGSLWILFVFQRYFITRNLSCVFTLWIFKLLNDLIKEWTPQSGSYKLLF